MSSPEPKPFRVEVAIDAPRDAVWRALTEPEQIRRWFGWDYAGLDAEIQGIFVDHATHAAPERIELDDGAAGQTIELIDEGARTLVRVVRPGPLGEARWEDIYDDVETGWLTFFEQLRHALERRPGEERRTVALEGLASAPAVLGALDGERWHDSRHLRMLTAPDGSLITAASRAPLTAAEPARLRVTLSTYALGDGAYAEQRRRWEDWWSELAQERRTLP